MAPRPRHTSPPDDDDTGFAKRFDDFTYSYVFPYLHSIKVSPNQVGLSEHLGLSRQALHNWRRGSSVPERFKLERMLGEKLGLEDAEGAVAWLLRGEGECPRFDRARGSEAAREDVPGVQVAMAQDEVPTLVRTLLEDVRQGRMSVEMAWRYLSSFIPAGSSLRPR